MNNSSGKREVRGRATMVKAQSGGGRARGGFWLG